MAVQGRVTALFSPATSRSAILSSPRRVASAASVPKPCGAEERHPGEVGDDRLDRRRRRGYLRRAGAGRRPRCRRARARCAGRPRPDGQEHRRPDACGVGRHEGSVGHGVTRQRPVTTRRSERRGRRKTSSRAASSASEPSAVRPVRTSSPAWGRPTSETSLSSSIGPRRAVVRSGRSCPRLPLRPGHPRRTPAPTARRSPRTATVQSSWARTFIQPVSTRRNTRWSAGRVRARPVSRYAAPRRSATRAPCAAIHARSNRNTGPGGGRPAPRCRRARRPARRRRATKPSVAQQRHHRLRLAVRDVAQGPGEHRRDPAGHRRDRAEVDHRQPAVGQHHEVAGVRVGVQQADPGGRGEHRLDDRVPVPVAARPARRVPRRAARRASASGRAVEPLRDQHLRRRGDHGRHVQVLAVGELGGEGALVVGLGAVVELLQRARPQLAHHRPRVEPGHDQREQPREPLEHPQVRVQRLVGARVLDLDGDRPPAARSAPGAPGRCWRRRWARRRTRAAARATAGRAARRAPGARRARAAPGPGSAAGPARGGTARRARRASSTRRRPAPGRPSSRRRAAGRARRTAARRCVPWPRRTRRRRRRRRAGVPSPRRPGR